MEEVHRKIIKRNIFNIIDKINEEDFDRLCKELVFLSVYPKNLIDKVLANGKDFGEKVLQFLISIETRGPTAFNALVSSFERIERTDIAQLLRNENIADFQEDEGDEIDSSIIIRKNGTNKKASILLTREINSQNQNSVRGEDKENSQVHEALNGQALEIFVKKAVKFNNGKPDDECYQMKSKPRGLALIINNIHFEGDLHMTRFGAEKDSENLTNLFKQLGYEVMLYTDVKKKDLLEEETGILSQFKKRLSESNVDSCVISINSHGTDRHYVRMSDPPINGVFPHVELWKDVFSQFSNRNFKSFAGKPKLFLINICRGPNINRTVIVPTASRIQTDGNDENRMCTPDYGSSEFSDFIFLYSTVPDHVSIRDLDEGTWFVTVFCEVVQKYACNHNFYELKRKIGEQMELQIDDKNRRQSCHYEESAKSKSFYFNPGL